MKVKLHCLLFILFLFACRNNKQDQEIQLSIFSQPKSIKANPKGGYLVNFITGDSISVLINSLGDTLITGIPIAARGRMIDSDSTTNPKLVTISSESELTKINAHANVHIVPKNIAVTGIHQDSLKQSAVVEIAKGDTSHYFLNSLGQKVKTGYSFPVRGKSIAAIQPKPVKALEPRFKDDALYDIRYLDVDQGMQSSYVKCVFEDQSGNLWFGSYGGGVSKYDGQYFIHYSKKEGLSDNVVSVIAQDKSGNLWFGTNGGGVSKYDGHSFVHYNEGQGLINNEISSIIEDRRGNLWFGTNGGGVTKFNPDRRGTGGDFTHYTEKEGLSNNKVRSIVEDQSGNIWFGTYGGGVSKYTPNSLGSGGIFIHFTEDYGLSSNYVNVMMEDQSGNLWIGTEVSGVTKYELDSLGTGGGFIHYAEKEGLISDNGVSAILEDRNGNIWFGNYGGGVSKFITDSLGIGGSFTHYSESEGLADNRIMSITEDRSGNIWFGTYGRGVSVLNPQSYRSFTKKEGLIDSEVQSILEDRRGNLWVGTWNGVLKYMPDSLGTGSFIHYTNREGLHINYTRSILEDRSGNLWFGTYGKGVVKYVPDSLGFGGRYMTYTEKEGLSSDIVILMIEDHRGNLWFGTYGGGVSKYTPNRHGTGGSFTHFTEKEGLSDNRVRSILEDQNCNIWIGTDGGGVSKFNPDSLGTGGSFTHYTEKEGLSSNRVCAILEDRIGNIWIGTNGRGITKYDPDSLGTGGTFSYYTEKEGLTNNKVMTFLEDNSGAIWISTENGLTELGVVEGVDSAPLLNGQKTKKLRYAIRQHGNNDGLKGVDFYTNSAYLDSKNRAWWGSGKCLTMLDLNKYSPATVTPRIQLRQVEINDQYIDFRNISDSLIPNVEYEGVQPFENYPLNLKLTYSKNHLTFRFSAIEWSAPHKIRYSYLLQGLNKAWSPPNFESKADFRNLPYGDFIFKIRAIGESGEWSEPFLYEFTIYPPWWHTWWARFAFGITAIALVAWIVRWRTRKLKEIQNKQEKEVEAATKDLVLKNEEISKQKDIVQESHKEITDSIIYAERIQRSFLATKALLDQNLNDYFVLFQPRDIVSGDFYWAGELNNGNFAMVNGDSTGHGVPGAIMSILNITSIESAFKDKLCNPAAIFNDCRKTIVERLKKDGSSEGGRDGMDASIVCFDFENNKITYTLAQNPIWIVREGVMTVISPEKMPVGKHRNDYLPFLGGEFETKKGDLIYTLTDGFQDQFGGPKGKKFMMKNLREYVLSICHLPMKEQDQKLKEAFANWKGDEKQIDDVCIIGVRI